MAEITLVQAVNLALARAMQDDPAVIVMGEDVGADGGVFRATDGLLRRFGPDRVHDTPLAEAAGNRFLLAAYNALGGQVQRFRLFGGIGVSDAGSAIAEHGTILEAFRAGDPAAARAQMHAHIEGVRTRAVADAHRAH